MPGTSLHQWGWGRRILSLRPALAMRSSSKPKQQSEQKTFYWNDGFCVFLWEPKTSTKIKLINSNFPYYRWKNWGLLRRVDMTWFSSRLGSRYWGNCLILWWLRLGTCLNIKSQWYIASRSAWIRGQGGYQWTRKRTSVGQWEAGRKSEGCRLAVHQWALQAGAGVRGAGVLHGWDPSHPIPTEASPPEAALLSASQSALPSNNILLQFSGFWFIFLTAFFLIAFLAPQRGQWVP